MRRGMVPPVGVLLTGILILAACSDGGEATTTTTPAASTTAPATPTAIEDGVLFAFVEVGDDGGVLRIDPAEMLTGEEAREAAVDAGIIGQGEDLPNDFFILNEVEGFEPVPVGDGAEFVLISGDDTSQQVLVDATTFAQIYDSGTHDEPVYGIPGGVPIVMNVTIADGVVTGAEAVYLP
ncbi:MAG TPA: hypothetical protein VFS66_14205 [Acidimicrobiia bacterium]|nr:hypothetical protein [Acidimicrobiia bacterium]